MQYISHFLRKKKMTKETKDTSHLMTRFAQLIEKIKVISNSFRTYSVYTDLVLIPVMDLR